MKNITHIFFDLDHTLWDTDRNAEESLRELFIELQLGEQGNCNFDEFHSAYRNHNNRLWGLYAENKVGREAVRIHRFQQTFQDFGIDDHAKVSQLADEFILRTPQKKHLIEGAHELLQHLSGRYKLNIITNGFRETQHIKLRGSHLLDYFEHIIISEEVGYHKPDPYIFKHAIELSGAASAKNCMMIGDTLPTDVLGALNAGWTAVYYAPKGETHPEPVITIRSLSELMKLL